MRQFSFANFILCIAYLFLVFTGCDTGNAEKNSGYRPFFSSDTSKNRTLLFGFPSFSYSETAAPFIKYLNNHLNGIEIKMKACASFEEYLRDMEHNEYDITLINGIQALDATSHGYTIFGKVIDNGKYSGVIFIRKNAGISKIADLSGKTIALVPSKTIPGTIMPLYHLYQQGLDVDHDIMQLKVSSFESAIIATYAGECDAGICLKRSWEVYISNHPEILSKVELKWESPPLVNNALLCRKNMDPLIKSQLVNLLFSMEESADGKEALNKLQFSGFEKANSATYKPMKDFKTKYDAAIHL
jgi:phosphonate transport system substrate-binding protein